jgi:hypothetical protein
VLLTYPPHILIGWVPPPVKDHVVGIEGVVSVHDGPVDPGIAEGYGQLALWGVEYWNSRFRMSKVILPQGLPLLVNDIVLEESSVSPPSKLGVGQEHPEGQAQTSAYMVGWTVVSVILLESNGVIDPNTEDWTEDQIGRVRTKVGEALEWWAKNAPDDAHVGFAVDTVMVRETSYEPINYPMRKDYEQRNRVLNEVMAGLSYATSKSYHDNVRRYVNDLSV